MLRKMRRNSNLAMLLTVVLVWAAITTALPAQAQRLYEPPDQDAPYAWNPREFAEPVQAEVEAREPGCETSWTWVAGLNIVTTVCDGDYVQVAPITVCDSGAINCLVDWIFNWLF